MSQRFCMGDFVHVSKDLGEWMSLFPCDVDAIVVGTNRGDFEGDERSQYSLHIKGRGYHAWYYGSQLTFIESNRCDKLKEWKNEKVERE